MPFYRRSLAVRVRPAGPVTELRDTCSLAALALLRQLAELCGHSVALLGDIEGHLRALARRAAHLHHRAARLQAVLRGRPLRAAAATATSNLDLESKKVVPAKLPWQQPVNVFLASGRPPGMEQLHQEAQLNLQSLLQEEYEEQYTESRVTGQTFRTTGHLPSDTPPEPSPRPPPAKRLEFVLMPPSQRVAEEESTSNTALSARLPDTSLSLPTSPDKQAPWPRAFPLPPVEEKQWHQPGSIQTNIVPINVSETAMNPKSTLRRRRTIIGFPNLSLRDQGSANGPTSSTHTPIAESLSCSFVPEATSRGTAPQEISPRQPLLAPLRKTFSDLGTHCCQPPAAMDGAVTPCASTCNGTQSTPFPPPWSTLGYGSSTSPTASLEKGPTCTSPGGSIASPSPGSPAAATTSFFISTEEHMGSNGPNFFSSPVPASPTTSGCIQEAKGNFLPGSREEPEPAAGPVRLQVERAGCRFRERSLSVPTDSGSLCSVDITYTETRRGSTNYALGYPSASSEGSTSTDNISLGLEPECQRRRRSKSISLKKAKKKPSPPMRSVSLIKEGQDGDVGLSAALPKDQRPKSLCIPPELQGHRLVHADPQGSARREPNSTAAPHQWHLTDWKGGSDPYQSLSSSSTTTGTTAIECAKTRDSSESLVSPSVSRATTPSQLSAEADLKTSSPGRPTGLMSPSSGYSSQSETPTPTIPTSAILGHSPHQVRVRPLVPERKSSLPPTSPMERSPKTRLSFDLPQIPPAHLDLSGLKISLKGKTKVSRHHSDSTFGTKLAQKTSPIMPIMPVVTQSDLRSVRLRSISRSETEDNADGPEHMEESARGPCPGSERKVKPPVAEKPPLAKRPPCILPKPPVLREEGPLSPSGTAAKEKGLPQDCFVVLRRGELRRGLGEPPSSMTPAGPRRLSQGSLEELQPERSSAADGERRKAKVPPPVPKKPSVLYLPLMPSPAQLGASMGDLPPTPSPIITLNTDPTCCDPDPEEPLSPKAVGNMQASDPASEQGEGSSAETSTEEKSFASDKTAESIVEEDDEVFTTSRTTEDLFTVIHRSKRKVLGRKEPGDTFSSRPTSHSPVKTSGSPTSESPAAAGSSGKSSSRNEDFKALLQKKSSKTSPGTRPSAAELLKTTNPLARRVITEFAPELDGANSPKSQP
ncbi:NHS-like protein 2 isoform X3 [Pithys albifrons albifrons]|uniref:NHS-like protein 2 isoform X3 n=1 Tax=Pithys albifrons albifrons TaxID=3385563 RepID=UPI003A5D1A27